MINSYTKKELYALKEAINFLSGEMLSLRHAVSKNIQSYSYAQEY